MNSLMDLPKEVLNSLLQFLPQESLLNLALTNFHFYEPCLRKLYRKLVIQVDPVLKYETKDHTRQRMDHIHSSCTTISGFASVYMNRHAHLRMLAAKLKTMIISITTNPALATYIEEIDVCGSLDSEVAALLKQLLDLLASVPNGIHKIYIADAKLRRSLGYHNIVKSFALTCVCIEGPQDLGHLSTSFPDCQEIIVMNYDGGAPLPASVVPVMEKLISLRIRNDPNVFSKFTEALLKLCSRVPFVMKHLKTFNVVQTHDNYEQQFPYIDFETLENLQISLGCNNATGCDQKCLELGLSRYNMLNPKRLSFIQSSKASLNSHKYTEKWDLTIFRYVKDTVESSDSLSYLSIRHNVPDDGIIDDGFEGNYIRKVKLYTLLLPNLLATIQRHVVNLVLPNLVASLACYEQPMNTFLWNGCQCPHCKKYLAKLDKFMLYHRYYNREKAVFKDVLTTQLMRSISEVLCDRIDDDPNLGDLFLLTKPMRNVTWDFHSSKFSIPLLCLPVKNYEMGYFEDEADEKAERAQRFFDAEDKQNDCIFLHQEKFVPNYSIVISHYLNDIIRRMINLNRGDAEDVKIGDVKDENDGFTSLRINKMLVNGIDYNFDHEINGTIFYVNSYDDTNDEY
ncbi:hypothetical protein A9F13_07g02794 [Clavispora lusitaniae]|uniref:F-box domain-containing protein n=1 Tax=Clavispora lusitaniae TaxID=36911 RepID=A0AA91Q079_CLALS|nr:hypothetical protein A9F13_07g02794 [Clavispora lusitaniae]